MGEHGLLEEHFVAVDGYPNYEVSNYGRVVNVKTGNDLSIRVGQSGVRYVKLSLNNKQTYFPLKRLVAQGFLVEYRPWIDVYLINDNKNDCSIMNLTLNAPKTVIEEPQVKNKEQIRIRETGEVFDTIRAVARRIDGSPGVIAKCLYGMGHTHKGYSFEYVH